MTNFLLKLFVKDYDNNNSKTREKVGYLSSVVGIVCNIFLFTIKFIMGTLTNSVAIVSDGFNNLSDCLSCIVTLGSYRLAAQPADKDHPFGHGRIEYLSSLFISVLILVVGFEFLKESVDKIFHPQSIIFSWIAIISLFVSILTKLWMGVFNKKLGNRYNSPSMLATADDSFSDCLTTSVAMASMLIFKLTNIQIDSYVGVLVSVLILKAGYGIIKETVDYLLGKPADQETLDSIMKIVFEHPLILGVHDVIVHNYGPGKIMASLHCEIDGNSDIFEAHECIDDIEHDLYNELHIMAVIHMDPIDVHNEQLTQYKQIVNNILKDIDPELSMHDFRMVPGEGHTNLIFDILLTHEYIGKSQELKKDIDNRLNKINPSLKTVIDFDTQF